MRQALFAIVLVAASFAGGALVNGPGLPWFRTNVLGRLGMADEPEVETTDPPAPIPARPIPPLALSAPAKPPGEPDPLPIAPAPDPATEPQPPPLALAPPPDLAPPPLDPPAALASSHERDRDALARAAGADKPPAHTRDPSVRLASLPLEPAPVPAPAATEPPPTTSPKDPSDWAEVRRELKALGVTRYGLDGEPSGRVRFHCVIPLAGRKAVGQHFEAEADDDLQAARAALRRIVLWRAAEHAP